MKESDIIPIIIRSMNDAEKLRSLTGYEKKGFVLQQLKVILTNESYETYAPILALIIDGLCKVKKEDIKMTFNKITRSCCK